MLGRHLIAAVLLCGWGGSAFAQTPLAPEAVVSSATTVDPARLALAHRLYEMMGADAFKAVSQSLTLGMRAGLARSGADNARLEAVVSAVDDGMAAIMPKVLDQSATLMAENFTYAQLQDMLAFYESPTGQVSIKKLPSLMKVSSAMSLRLLPQMIEVMQTSYCRRVSCTPQETQMFAAIEARMRQQAGAATASQPAG